MKLGLLEDRTLVELARTVVGEGGGDVKNAQISGLLSVVRASGSYDALHRMAQKQRDKAQRDTSPSEVFYGRLCKALLEIEKLADEYVREISPTATGKPDRTKKAYWRGRLASTLMTHIATEHRWQGNRQ